MKFGGTILEMASMFVLWAGLGAAQAQQPTPTTATEAPAEPAPPGQRAPGARRGEEEIVVTGSRVRRKDLTTPAPVTVLTRQQWEESGKVTIGDLRAEPQGLYSVIIDPPGIG